jgi:hypothetical protein
MANGGTKGEGGEHGTSPPTHPRSYHNPTPAPAPRHPLLQPVWPDAWPAPTPVTPRSGHAIDRLGQTEPAGSNCGNLGSWFISMPYALASCACALVVPPPHPPIAQSRNVFEFGFFAMLGSNRLPLPLPRLVHASQTLSDLPEFPPFPASLSFFSPASPQRALFLLYTARPPLTSISRKLIYPPPSPPPHTHLVALVPFLVVSRRMATKGAWPSFVRTAPLTSWSVALVVHVHTHTLCIGLLDSDRPHTSDRVVHTFKSK